MSINWRSGNLDVSIIDNAGISHKLLTVQNIDFRFDENIEVMDSLSQQRIGYFYAPRRIRITMGVLPSQYTQTDTVSDSITLVALQAELISGANLYDGIFTLTVTDDHQGHVYTFNECIVMEGAPSNVVMDRRPVTQWTLLALDGNMSDSTGEVISYLTEGQTDDTNDTSQ